MSSKTDQMLRMHTAREQENKRNKRNQQKQEKADRRDHGRPPGQPEITLSGENMIREIHTKPVLIFGCGNTLFGDDGFGPSVIAHMQKHCRIPENVAAEDAGTSISGLLFDMALSPNKPRTVFIADAVSVPGKHPGELFELEIHKLPRQKTGDYSLHQFPSVNLLRELQQTAGVNIRILCVQIKEIPETVCPGLSAEVSAAIPRACSWLLSRV